jgi:anti-sigma regulatory factor (Ser/Thr protein kinase)
VTCCALAEKISGCTLADIRLANAPESASAARRIIRAVTCAWGAYEAADRAELLTCELVTNAAKHARDPLGSDIHVVISRRYDRLRVDVHDASPTMPRIRRGDLMAEEGRGLAMAETLADMIGWRPAAHGKTVYFELTAWPLVYPRR